MAEPKPICKEYLSYKNKSFIMSNIVSFSILGINMLLRSIIIYLISWIGFKTHSKVILTTSTCVFVAYYFNTVIVVILVYADLGFFFDAKGTLLPHIMEGIYADYNSEWYKVVGDIIVTTESLRWIFPPLCEFGMMFVGWLFQKYDQGMFRKDKDSNSLPP